VEGEGESKQENLMSKLEGKVAVITGGNSGIGLATAQRFVAEGAYVFITGRRQGELDAAVKQIGKSVTAVQGDVSNASSLENLVMPASDHQLILRTNYVTMSNQTHS
jgi:NAD(P)-dependent dehydrogenase (short-subunit alcohol dehydrogenase family)